jgi:Holliday junction resolvase
VASPRANKRKGADWEIALRNGFREEGFDIERLHLNGKDDEGDLVIREADGVYLVIEAKDSAFQPGTFIGELEREVEAFARNRELDPGDVDGIAVVKRRGMSWRKAFVLTTVEDYFGLDEEVKK